MFWKKEEYVSCETCKCLLKKEDASVVNLDTIRIYLWDIPHASQEYYCNVHKKPYTAKRSGFFFKEVAVTEDGTPVGYVKAKKKK